MFLRLTVRALPVILMVSLVSPCVFFGILALGATILCFFCMDDLCERARRRLERVRVPLQLWAMGILLSAGLFVLGLLWGPAVQPGSVDSACGFLPMVCAVGAHLACLMAFLTGLGLMLKASDMSSN